MSDLSIGVIPPRPSFGSRGQQETRQGRPKRPPSQESSNGAQCSDDDHAEPPDGTDPIDRRTLEDETGTQVDFEA